MKAVQAVEPGLLLPRPPRELNSPLGDPDAGLGAEERITAASPFAASPLVRPESAELRHEGVRREHVPGASALGDLGPDAHPGTRGTLRRVDVPDVQADDLGKAEAGAERQAVD